MVDLAFGLYPTLSVVPKMIHIKFENFLRSELPYLEDLALAKSELKLGKRLLIYFMVELSSSNMISGFSLLYSRISADYLICSYIWTYGKDDL